MKITYLLLSAGLLNTVANIASANDFDMVKPADDKYPYAMFQTEVSGSETVTATTLDEHPYALFKTAITESEALTATSGKTPALYDTNGCKIYLNGTPHPGPLGSDGMLDAAIPGFYQGTTITPFDPFMLPETARTCPISLEKMPLGKISKVKPLLSPLPIPLRTDGPATIKPQILYSTAQVPAISETDVSIPNTVITKAGTRPALTPRMQGPNLEGGANTETAGAHSSSRNTFENSQPLVSGPLLLKQSATCYPGCNFGTVETQHLGTAQHPQALTPNVSRTPVETELNRSFEPLMPPSLSEQKTDLVISSDSEAFTAHSPRHASPVREVSLSAAAPSHSGLGRAAIAGSVTSTPSGATYNASPIVTSSAPKTTPRALEESLSNQIRIQSLPFRLQEAHTAPLYSTHHTQYTIPSFYRDIFTGFKSSMLYRQLGMFRDGLRYAKYVTVVAVDDLSVIFIDHAHSAAKILNEQLIRR